MTAADADFQAEEALALALSEADAGFARLGLAGVPGVGW